MRILAIIFATLIALGALAFHVTNQSTFLFASLRVLAVWVGCFAIVAILSYLYDVTIGMDTSPEPAPAIESFHRQPTVQIASRGEEDEDYFR